MSLPQSNTEAKALENELFNNVKYQCPECKEYFETEGVCKSCVEASKMALRDDIYQRCENIPDDVLQWLIEDLMDLQGFRNKQRHKEIAKKFAMSVQNNLKKIYE